MSEEPLYRIEQWVKLVDGTGRVGMIGDMNFSIFHDQWAYHLGLDDQTDGWYLESEIELYEVVERIDVHSAIRKWLTL